MNQRFGKAGMKAAAFMLSAAVWMGSMVPAFAAENKENDQNSDVVTQDVKNAKNQEISKDETVYVKLLPDGTKKEVIVSDWLKNPDKTASLEDQTDLKDIKNVKGDETFAESNGQLLWDSKGNDIYYQGTTDKELPITMKITYFLDGKQMTPEEIAGKSGKVKIRYEYENHSKTKINVDGQTENVATPFAVVTGIILPGDNFSNVSVDGGRVLSDGKNNIVAGMVFPGLSDSLSLEESDLTKDMTLPEAIEVTADAKNFEIDLSATIVTSSIFDELGLDDIDSVDELTDALNELSDASSKLVDGSGELLDGVSALKDASKEFASGIDTLYEKSGELLNGMNTLDESAGKLSDGIHMLNDQKKGFLDGVSALSDGVGKLVEGSGSLKDGVSRYTDGVSSLDQGIDSLQSKAGALVGGVGTVNEGAKKLQAGAAVISDDKKAEALKTAANALTDGVKTIHENLVALKNAVEKAPDDQSAAAMVGLVNQSMQTLLQNDQSVLTLLKDAKDVKERIDSVKGLAPEAIREKVDEAESMYSTRLEDAIRLLSVNINIESTIIEKLSGFTAKDADFSNLLSALQQLADKTDPDKADSLYAGLAAYTAGTNALLDGTRQLKSGIDSLAGGTDALYDGVKKLPEGVSALTAGSQALVEKGSELNEGVTGIYDGTVALSGGVKKLSSGVAALSDGVVALSDGAMALKGGTGKLSDGTKKLYEGVGKLKDGSSKLTDGVKKLYDGAVKLSDGMQEFDRDGVKKLKSTVDDEFVGMIERMKAVIDAGKDYQTFTKLSDGAKGCVKFVIQTEAIKAE